MEQQAYQDLMMSRPYNGLQLIPMTYEQAYEFADIYGMNAIIVHLNRGRVMEMARLKQTLNNKLKIINGQILENPEDYDIYWIGLK